MKSKKQELLDSIAKNELKTALSIAKNFVIEFSKEEQRVLQIAHESQQESNANFYIAIGVDVSQIKIRAKNILENYYQRFG